MSNDATPRLNLPYLAAGQAQKHVTLNETLAALDGLVQTAVQSRSVAAQPGAPVDGELYILPAGRSGAEWALHPVGAVVRFEAGAWSRLAASAGCVAYVADEGRLVFHDGAAWHDLGTSLTQLQNLDRLGIGTAADAANPLAAEINKALFTARTAAEGGDGDLRFTLNKESAADVLSLLFQSGFSGRAELGLVGDDQLALKVSADGASWREALRVGAGGEVIQPRKPMAAAMRTAGAVTLTTTPAPFVFDAETLDSRGDYDPATGRFTCPAPGRYRVSARVMLDASTALGASVQGFVGRNGANAAPGRLLYRTQTGGYLSASMEWALECAAGDVLEVMLYGDAPSAVVVLGSDLTYATFEHLG